jgi:acyl-CoA dehydrogenase
MLGGRDAAYDDMVKPFREIEDIMMMGPLTGASMRQLELFMNMISSRKYKLDDEQKASLGKIDSLIRALKILAAESAMLLENDRQSQKKQAYIIAFRSIFKDVQSGIGDLILQCGIEADNEFKRLSNDLGFSGQIAPAAAKLREIKYGDYVMTRKEFNG